MNIVHIILALACFGIGFLIADTDIVSSPLATAAIILAVLGVSMILRYFSSKKDK